MRTAADTRFLVNETLALFSRLQTVRSFSLSTPMVLAAAVSAPAQAAINAHLAHVAFDLRRKLLAFVGWLRSPESQRLSAAKTQARYVLLKLRFNNLLDQVDIFADVLGQRSEHGTGTWVAGLDVLAEDALTLPGGYYTPPPLICFLERGHGAAIRRARTRLPGGDLSPVGVIQIPRERMIGSGIASSLIHEVGHQGSELLDLTSSIRAAIEQVIADGAKENALPWQLLSRWLNEILSDCWALGHLGITATYGLLSVVSLPSYFVFRIGTDGPHPFPWIRMKISIALGAKMFPHPQWAALSQQWEDLYPPTDLGADKQDLIHRLEAVLPVFADLVLSHRPASLKGQRVADIFPLAERQPAQLQALYDTWQQHPYLREHAAPSLVFAVVGQAKADGRLSTNDEVRVLSHLLERWALNRARTYGTAPALAAPPPTPAPTSTFTLKPRTHAPRIKH
ncbi:hypothetical protein GO988_15790 [Hymenobacter sp. HMF4947]|uniref:Uncharacterized protein n=1 Tax=Hymenobacter ginkgonis TaxID=2682976 RepID=A0A7K1THF3_9BACT|nr:hypothetical protein [Hymenobacter ginkgonis]MVN77793.1 hypothetical protein [Hymenobacter ginkgonis]